MTIPLKRCRLRCYPLLILFIGLEFTACSVAQSAGVQQHETKNIPSTLLISRDVPAFASSGSAHDANDNSFDSLWWSNGVPAWLAYDVSRVPPSERGKVLLVWYNETFNYDHTVIKDVAYNIPGSYTIDLNFAPGGTSSPPTTGWQTVVTVVNNHYHSRQHAFDMKGANWVRMNITVADGSTENYSARLNMDIYDANYALTSDFIDFGDSITAGSMSHITAAGVPSFADLVHDQLPDQFPVEEDGGIGYLTSFTPVDPQHNYLQTWLSIFPGTYVGLSYGTNDSFGCPDPTAIANSVYQNYVAMVRLVLEAGKIPIVPHMIWSPRSDLEACALAINARLDHLYKAFPQVIPGPDLYTVFKNHPEDFGDGIHPNSQGIGLYRQAWANFFVRSIFHQQGIA